MQKYPNWVYQHRTKGTSLKKVGENYYLYKTTSRRVPGMKNPQPVSEYLGVITPTGVIDAKRISVPLEDVRVWEYGFSEAIIRKIPKNADIDEVSKAIIKESPYSFLRTKYKTQEEATDGGFLEGLLGFPLSRIEILKGIFLVEAGEKKVLSVIDDEQRMLLNELEVDLCLTPK